MCRRNHDLDIRIDEMKVHEPKEQNLHRSKVLGLDGKPFRKGGFEISSRVGAKCSQCHESVVDCKLAKTRVVIKKDCVWCGSETRLWGGDGTRCFKSGFEDAPCVPKDKVIIASRWCDCHGENNLFTLVEDHRKLHNVELESCVRPTLVFNPRVDRTGLTNFERLPTWKEGGTDQYICIKRPYDVASLVAMAAGGKIALPFPMGGH